MDYGKRLWGARAYDGSVIVHFGEELFERGIFPRG